MAVGTFAVTAAWVAKFVISAVQTRERPTMAMVWPAPLIPPVTPFEIVDSSEVCRKDNVAAGAATTKGGVRNRSPIRSHIMRRCLHGLRFMLWGNLDRVQTADGFNHSSQRRRYLRFGIDRDALFAFDREVVHLCPEGIADR